MLKKNSIVLAATLLVSQSLLAAEKTTMLVPDALEWKATKDMPAGAEVVVLAGNPAKKEPFIARVKLPANYVVPPHRHPVNEYDTVIAGTYFLGTGEHVDKTAAQALPTGGFAILPAMTSHYGFTEQETILQVSGVGPWGMIYR